MAPRYPSVLQPPLAFARGDPSTESPQDPLAGFAGHLALGATGLEVEAWLTADGEPVLHHGATVRSGLRRRPLAELRRAQLPPTIPRLSQLYERCGTGYELALAAGDDDTVAAVVAVAREAGDDAEGRLWLHGPSWTAAASWRTLSADVHLVDVTRIRNIDEGPERRAATVAGAGIDAVRLPESDWSPGLTTLFHRFGRLAFSGPAAHRRQLDALLAMGVDAVSSAQVERMVAAVTALADPPAS